MLTAGYLALVAYVTLTPNPQGWGPDTFIGRSIDWLTRHGVPHAFAIAEAGGNVLMFIPFGILAWLWVRRWWVAVLLGAFASCMIELTQYSFLPTRYPSLQDVAMNTLGTAVGVLLVAVLARLTRPPR